MIGSHVIGRKRSRWGQMSAAKRAAIIATSPAAAAGVAYGASKYFGVGRKVGSSTHGSGVSLQRDRTVQYVSKHKRGWKRKMKRWKKFVRKVRAVQLKDHGKLSMIMDDFISATSLAGQQVGAFILLGGVRGNGTGEADMRNLFDEAVAQSPDASRLLLNTMVLDLQITTTEATESSCELDVYEFVCIKDVPNTIFGVTASTVTMDSFFTKGLTAQPTVGAGGTQLATTSLGTTPFDNRFFCQHFKIVKKTKYLLGLNQYVTYQIRDPKNRVIPGYQRRDLLAMKGFTRGVMLIAKGLVSGGAIPTTDFAVYSNRHYTFSVLQSQTDAAETY